MKSMSKAQLLDLVPENFSFYTEPWDHQIASFIASISAEKLLLALDLGTGKTKVSIDVGRYAQKQFGAINGYVVCLNNAVEKWVDEISKHSRELTSIAVRGEALRNGDWWDPKSRIIKTAKEAKLDLLCSTDFNFRVISFESLRSCCTERIKASNGAKGYDQIHIPSIKRVLRTRPNFFIIDESHKVKNKDSLIFDIINRLSSSVRWRLLLAGTPFHNLLDLWAQYYILDRGRTFGSNYYRFRQENFDEKRRYIKSKGIEISKWVVTPEGKKYIMDRMYTSAIRYDESEVHDMPGKVFNIEKYNLSKQQRSDYLKILKAAEGSDEKKKFGENQSMTFRQICSGFIIKTKKIYKENPKLDLLESLVEGIVEKDKVVIFHEFRLEHDLIVKRLKKMRIKYTAINGGVTDKYGANQAFLYDERVRVCVVSVSSGSSSIDLQSARYAIFFNNARSVIDRKQAIKRIHRGDINRTRFYYDLIGNNTVENSVYKSLKDGVDLFDEIMDKERFLEVMKGEV